jgi:hypothetical protein
MTESELEILRIKVGMEAIRVLLRGLYTGLANSSPTAAQGFREKFSALRKNHGEIALEGVAPEYSDLMAGEYQEALDDLLTFIESGFHS